MEKFTISTSSTTQFIDITNEVSIAVGKTGIIAGTATIYCPHTTGGITINEGADPAVKRDILHVLNSIVPWDADYRHMEGNSPAHIKTLLTGSSVQVIIEDSRPCIGTWQRIFFCEYDGPRKRTVWVQVTGK